MSGDFILPKYGAGWGNEPAGNAAFEAEKLARHDAFKLISTNYPAGDRPARLRQQKEVDRLKETSPDAVLYMRLPDSFTDAGVRPLDDYVDLCVWYIDGGLEVDCLHYQLCNEPNDRGSAWVRKLYPDADKKPPWIAARDYYMAAIPRIRQRVKRAVRLGSAPLQHAPGKTVYVPWYNSWSPLWEMCDEVTANVYYHAKEHITESAPVGWDNGRSWEWYSTRTDKPIVIGEHGVPPEYKHLRAELVPMFLDSILGVEQIIAAFYFLWFGTIDWSGWFPDNDLVMALANWRAGLRLVRD